MGGGGGGGGGGTYHNHFIPCCTCAHGVITALTVKKKKYINRKCMEPEAAVITLIKMDMYTLGFNPPSDMN